MPSTLSSPSSETSTQQSQSQPTAEQGHQLPASDSAQEKVWLKAIEQADENILERIRFRETRLYWLYVGSFAIIAGLIHLMSEKPIHENIFYAGLFTIQLLCMGIAWNYFANNIKICKLELLQRNIYKRLNIEGPPKDTRNMEVYTGIYHFVEVAAFTLPSLVAGVCMLHIEWFIQVGINTTEVAQCCCCFQAVREALAQQAQPPHELCFPAKLMCFVMPTISLSINTYLSFNIDRHFGKKSSH